MVPEQHSNIYDKNGCENYTPKINSSSLLADVCLTNNIVIDKPCIISNESDYHINYMIVDQRLF